METGNPEAGSSDFGALLRHYRIAAGLSQEALAERAGMSIEGISALERGFRRTPQRATLRLLADALNLDDAEARELGEAAARRGLLGRGGPASVRVGPWAARGASLPIANKTFIGRDTELREIAALLSDHRLVTLTGAGGIGKTQTALQVATALRLADDDVRFVDLAPIRDDLNVVAAIASALGVQEVPNKSLLETLQAYLKSKPLLVILDNCEHVVEEAARVTEHVMTTCARLRIMATSREPLRVAGEHAYRLPSLDAASASALFADRAYARDHRFALTDDGARIVAAICRHLDGIPLAIELAAARVAVLSLSGLAKKLDDHLAVLKGGPRTALPRQQTMRAAIDWSYELLSPEEQRVFERLSVFAGGATFAAAVAVCSDADASEDGLFDQLSSLADKSMVLVDLQAIEPRYHLLESFRQYAAEKLAIRGEQEMALRRHASAYLERAKEFGAAFDDEPDDVWGALAHHELDNWRTALQWALTGRGDVVVGQRIAGELTMLWHFFAPFEGRDWVASAIDCVSEQTPPEVVALLSYARAFGIGLTYYDLEGSLGTGEDAIARYSALGDELGLARSQRLAGCAFAFLGRFAQAEALLHDALAAARRLKNRKLVANILFCLSGANYKVGDLTVARRHLAEAVRIYQTLGAELGLATATGALANYEFSAGNAEAALVHAMDSFAAFRAAGHTQGVTTSLTNLAGYLLALGRYEEAEQRARAALALAIQLDHDSLAASALLHLGAVATLRAEHAEDRRLAYAQAARLLGFVEPYVTRSGPQASHKNDEFDPILALLRDVLDPTELAKLMCEGAAMTREEAVEEASASNSSAGG
jgi:predicted ATPase/DNA-binding XRE family transcriptional regulator